MSARKSGTAISSKELFDVIYSTDVAFVKDCWKLCGDAHCCKNNDNPPLLPGEYDYLLQRNLLSSFEKHTHTESKFTVAKGVVKYEALSFKPGGCKCKNDSRLSVCRLYPLRPIYSVEHGLIGVVEGMGVSDILEEMFQKEKSCKVNMVSFKEISKFVYIANAIYRQPDAFQAIMMYNIVHEHFKNAMLKRTLDMDPNEIAEFSNKPYLLLRVLGSKELKKEIDQFHEEFEKHYPYAQH